MARKLNIDWDKAIQEYKESGKSLAQFCKEKGFSANTFYLNRQKLKKQGFVKINPVSAMTHTSSIKMEYKGITIPLEEGFSPGLLQQILSALGLEK